MTLLEGAAQAKSLASPRLTSPRQSLPRSRIGWQGIVCVAGLCVSGLSKDLSDGSWLCVWLGFLWLSVMVSRCVWLGWAVYGSP